MNALGQQVIWIYRVCEFLAERGQTECRFRVGGGQSMADELQNPKKRFGAQVTGGKRTVRRLLQVAQVKR